MNDDKLLEQLGALAREQQHDDAPGESLDAGAQERIANALAAGLRKKAPSPWRSRVAFVSGGLALAAALSLVVGRTSSTELPLYTLDSTGVAGVRGPGPEGELDEKHPHCRLRADVSGSFELVARPDGSVDGNVSAHVFTVHDASTIEPWRGALDVSPKGAVRITGENRMLVETTELRIVVHRSRTLSPAEALAIARSPDAASHGVRVLSCEVEAARPR